MGYGAQYSQYILLEVKRGQLMRSVQLNGESYELFKDMQFQAYKQTPDYKSQRDSMLKEGESQAFIDSFLRDFVIDYTAQILEGALNFRDSETGQPAPASIRQHEVEVPQSELEKSGLKFESMPHHDTSVSGCQTNEPTLPLMAFLLSRCVWRGWSVKVSPNSHSTVLRGRGTPLDRLAPYNGNDRARRAHRLHQIASG